MALIGDASSSYPAIAMVQRSIAYIIPDVTIEELTRDDLVLTDQPVEEGTAVTDHSFKLPAVLQMKIGFSDSTGMSEGYAKQQYARLLALQLTRKPFEVQTGKRTFKNMLLSGVTLVTDHMSEYSANIEAQLREINIVKRQQSSGGADNGTTASPSTGTDAGTANTGPGGAGPATAPASDSGTVAPVPDDGADGRPLTVPTGDISPTYDPAPITAPGADTSTPAFVGATGGDAVATPGDGLGQGLGTKSSDYLVNDTTTGPATFQRINDSGQFGVHAFGN